MLGQFGLLAGLAFLLNWLFARLALVLLAWVGFTCWVSFLAGLALVLVGFVPG